MEKYLFYGLVFHVLIPLCIHFYGAYRGINKDENNKRSDFSTSTQLMVFFGILIPMSALVEKMLRVSWKFFSSVNNLVESKGEKERTRVQRKKVLELKIEKIRQTIAESSLEDTRMMSWVSTLDELEEELSKY